MSSRALSILTTRHCWYVARTIEAALDGPVAIAFAPPEAGFAPGRHIVICPQIFDRLPEDFIAFQMEQSISPRWFAPPLLAKLRRARAIVDYSARNLRFLQGLGFAAAALHHLPIAYIPNFRPDLDRASPPRHDVLFYGDANNPRRRRILDALHADFDLAERARIFGDDLYREILAAKIVVNVHYYEGALLETTRLMECLSLGALVVSETAPDVADYPELQGLVDFVPLGDGAALQARLRYWLDHPERRAARIASARLRLGAGVASFRADLRKIVSKAFFL